MHPIEDQNKASLFPKDKLHDTKKKSWQQVYRNNKSKNRNSFQKHQSILSSHALVLCFLNTGFSVQRPLCGFLSTPMALQMANSKATMCIIPNCPFSAISSFTHCDCSKSTSGSKISKELLWLLSGNEELNYDFCHLETLNFCHLWIHSIWNKTSSKKFHLGSSGRQSCSLLSPLFSCCHMTFFHFGHK